MKGGDGGLITRRSPHSAYDSATIRQGGKFGGDITGNQYISDVLNLVNYEALGEEQPEKYMTLDDLCEIVKYPN